MAWRTLLPCPPPDYFLLPTVAATIACQDLQPGDAVVSEDHVQVCHVALQSYAHSTAAASRRPCTLHPTHCSHIHNFQVAACHSHAPAALPPLEQLHDVGVHRVADGGELGQGE
jgi:hypothetical protein